MKKFILILQIIVGTILIFFLQSCGGEEIEHPWYPVDLEITGATVDDHEHFDYDVTIPPSGGKITVKGYGERVDWSYIRKIYDVSVNKYYAPEDSSQQQPYWGSNSWLTGDWWNVKYIKENPPYEMIINIEPNLSKDERTLIIEYGCCYTVSKLTLTQKGK